MRTLLTAAAMAVFLGLAFQPGEAADEPAVADDVHTEIQGPWEMQPDGTCLFTADVTGGTPPYTYQWWRDGVPMGTGSTALISRQSGSSATEIRVQLEAWDYYDDQDYTERIVDLDEEAMPCMN